METSTLLTEALLSDAQCFPPTSTSKLVKGLQKECPCHSLEFQTALKILRLQFNSWRISFFLRCVLKCLQILMFWLKFSCCDINTHSHSRLLLLHLLYLQPDKGGSLISDSRIALVFFGPRGQAFSPLYCVPEFSFSHVLVSHILHTVGTKAGAHMPYLLFLYLTADLLNTSQAYG